MRRKFNISSMMDIPCGDLHWMPRVDLTGIRYYGADISNVVIQQNKERIALVFESDNARSDEENMFVQWIHSSALIELLVLDAVQESFADEVKRRGVELLFVRHMMMHLSRDHNLAVLENIERSGIQLLMATTFLPMSPSIVADNSSDYHLVVGHRINLMGPPYCLEYPEILFQDTDTSRQAPGSGQDRGMYIGIWRITNKKLKRKSNC